MKIGELLNNLVDEKNSLRSKVIFLAKENGALKAEVSRLKDSLQNYAAICRTEMAFQPGDEDIKEYQEKIESLIIELDTEKVKNGHLEEELRELKSTLTFNKTSDSDIEKPVKTTRKRKSKIEE